MSTVAEHQRALAAAPAVYELPKQARMSGAVPLRFDRNESGARQIHFGGKDFGDGCPEIKVNGKQYRVCGRLVEERPGEWKANFPSDILRVPGQMGGATPNAAAKTYQEMRRVAPALAEKHSDRFDTGAASALVTRARNLRQLAENSRAMAAMFDRQAEIAEMVADGSAVLRPYSGDRVVVDFGPEVSYCLKPGPGPANPAGRGDLAGHVLMADDNEVVGYIVIRDRYQVLLAVVDARFSDR